MPLRALTHLDELSFFDETLQGWHNQLIARGAKDATVKSYCNTVRTCFLEVLQTAPWRCSRADIDRWSVHFIEQRKNRRNTMRNKHTFVRQYLRYLCNDAYPWAAICYKRFGLRPRQLCVAENTTRHVAKLEGSTKRRCLSVVEVERFFDEIRRHIRSAVEHHVKGALTSARDYALYTVMLCWGLRDKEVAALLPQDLWEAVSPELKRRHGTYDTLQIREGKAPRNGPPKRREVQATPLFERGVAVLRWYCEHVRPKLPPSPLLFVTERGDRLSTHQIGNTFAKYRDAAHLPKELTPYLFRHNYVTWLRTDGYDVLFVKDQVGHEFTETTDGYTHIDDDFTQTLLNEAYQQIWP